MYRHDLIPTLERFYHLALPIQIASIHGTPQKFNIKLILQLRQERCPLSLTILCAA